MKTIIKSTLVAAALVAGLTACSDDWLNTKNEFEETADTFWKTAEQFDQGLSAAYSTWRRPGYFSRWFQIHTILRSDEGWSESPNAEFQADANFNMKGYNYDGNEGLNLPWSAFYSSVYYSNQVIDNILDHGYDLIAKEEADQMLGQAYFIRGLAEWAIAGIYGRGPLNVSSIKYGRVVDEQDLYAQAATDFEEAAKYLPLRWTSKEVGRVTKGAAIGMAAKMNMQLAGMYSHRPWATGAQDGRNGNVAQDPATARQYWLKAKEQLETVMSPEFGYKLMDNWMDNFTEANENNAESLFEIQFKDGLINGNEVGNQRPKFLGLYLTGGEGAWNDGSARDWLLAEFDKEKDKDGNVDPRKFHTLFYYDPAEPQTATAKYYGKTWSEWANDGLPAEGVRHACYWKKYTSVETDNKKEDYSSGANLRILRFADVYLMYAEVINELVNNGGCDKSREDAVEYINKVRRRSNMADLTQSYRPKGYWTYNPDKNTFTEGTSLDIFGSYEDLLECIRHERMTELCGENTRWFDLDRWGDLHDQGKVNTIATRDADFRNFIVGNNHVWCIPNHEINLWEGEEEPTRLTQNPGY